MASFAFADPDAAATGVMMNIAVADQYLCILLTGNMFKDIYDKEGYERRLLSRTTEDSVTVTSVLVPWNTCGKRIEHKQRRVGIGVADTLYVIQCIQIPASPA